MLGPLNAEARLRWETGFDGCGWVGSGAFVAGTGAKVFDMV